MLTDNSDAPLILIVEDDNNHAELIRRSFEDVVEEYRLEIAGCICDAKRAAQNHAPSLVLTDYRLPDGDGSEMVVMAAGQWPVIIMTSHGSEQVAVEAMKIGAQDYIVKSPETFDNLSVTVKYALMAWALVVVRRQSDEAIVKAKKDWERTFDAVPDLISIIDCNYTITRVNRSMAQRCGLTPEKMIGLKCHVVMHGMPTPHPSCPHFMTLKDGLMHKEEIEEKRLASVFDVTVSPLCDADGQVSSCVHVMRDITEWKRANEERQAFEAQFQQTQKLESLGVLAGGIAHDFNNILTIILGHCYMAMDNTDSSPAHKNHVLKIESAANRAAELCRQMLAYAGNSPLVNVKIDLCLLVDEIVKMLQSAIKKNVDIQLDLRRDVPEFTGDNAHIQQVVMNLIINAAEAIDEKNGIINVAVHQLTISDLEPVPDFFDNPIKNGNYACLEVSDNGCGMDEEIKKRIFEPFYTTKFTGRGLGMSAILGIIKSHHGALQLTSATGCGTTFKVFFPLAENSAAVEAVKAVQAAPSVPAKGTILLVDDETSILTIGSALLNAMGFSTVTAANGPESLEIIRERGGEIDLVLLDLIMPQMGGVDTYYELRKLNRNIPIVFCSGYGVEGVLDTIDSDLNIGAIMKPYNPDQLRSLLQAMVGAAA
jgi:PAS domain S-box-containing protein